MNPHLKLKLRKNAEILRERWWYSNNKRRRKILNRLCIMCHQNRFPRKLLTASKYDKWCDECFFDLPDWLKYDRTTKAELDLLSQRKEEAKEKRRKDREEKAAIAESKKKKKVKLTGFENVENEETPEIISPQTEPESKAKEAQVNYEKQRQELELIYNYNPDD